MDDLVEDCEHSVFSFHELNFLIFFCKESLRNEHILKSTFKQFATSCAAGHTLLQMFSKYLSCAAM